MVDSLVEQDKIFAEIDEAYRKFTADPELRYIYEARLKAKLDRNSMQSEALEDTLAEGKADGLAEGEVIGIEKGKAIGIAEGEAKGLANGKVETARNFKRIGVATDIIIQATGLTREEVEGL